MLLDMGDGRRSATASCAVLASIMFIWCSMTVLYELTGFREQAKSSIISITAALTPVRKGDRRLAWAADRPALTNGTRTTNARE